MNRRNITIFVSVICLVTIIMLFFCNSSKRKLSEANKFLNNGQTTEAITTFKELVPNYKVGIEARYGLAKAYLKMKNYKEAEKGLISLINNKPDYYEANIELYDLYKKQKRTDEAYQVIKKYYDLGKDTRVKKLLDETEKEIKNKLATPIKLKGGEVYINQELQSELNIFMSNFAEVPFDMSFNEGKISDKKLILFGFWHNYRNYYRGISLHGTNRIEVENLHDKLKKEYVDEAVKKYFDINKINHQTIPVDKYNSYEYKNGYYYTMHGDGENPIDYSVVYKVVNIGNGKYIVYAKNYHNSEYTTKNPYDYNYYSIDTDKAEKLYENDLNGYKVDRVNAKIQKTNENGVERYVLLQYKLN